MSRAHGGWIFVTTLASVAFATAAGVQGRVVTMAGFSLIAFILFIITLDGFYL